MALRDYSIQSLSEDRRAELGHDRLFLRPPSPCADVLDGLAERLQTNRSLAAAFAIHMASKAVEGMTKAQLKEAVAFVLELKDARVGE
jgi:hypothetical protein